MVSTPRLLLIMTLSLPLEFGVYEIGVVALLMSLLAIVIEPLDVLLGFIVRETPVTFVPTPPMQPVPRLLPLTTHRPVEPAPAFSLSAMAPEPAIPCWQIIELLMRTLSGPVSATLDVHNRAGVAVSA